MAPYAQNTTVLFASSLGLSGSGELSGHDGCDTLAECTSGYSPSARPLPRARAVFNNLGYFARQLTGGLPPKTGFVGELPCMDGRSAPGTPNEEDPYHGEEQKRGSISSGHITRGSYAKRPDHRSQVAISQ